jgi:hypothetical protein
LTLGLPLKSGKRPSSGHENFDANYADLLLEGRGLSAGLDGLQATYRDLTSSNCVLLAKRQGIGMGRLLAIAALGSLMTGHFAFAGDKPQQQGVMPPGSLAEVDSAGLPALPPLPPGKATVMGGEIHNVDPVRDQFTLKVPGGHPIKLLYDARTQIYRDGAKVAPGGLRSGDRASVETVLDGTNVFALVIHMLSRPPEGEYQGQVMSYDPRSRQLTVTSDLSREPIRLLVPPNTPTIREEQATSSSTRASAANFVAGTLLSVKFESDNQGRGVASQIAILATPGSSFVFSGNIASLDLHTGLLVLVDPSSDKSYELSFDPARIPLTRNLHLGEHATVTASFTGARYVASAIAVD